MQGMDVDVPATSEAPPALQPEQCTAGEAPAGAAGKDAESAKEAAAEPSALDKTAEFFKNLPRYAWPVWQALRNLQRLLLQELLQASTS